MNTLWKISEQERVLKGRVNEEFVRDFVKGQMEKFEHSYIDYFNKQVPRLEKRYLEQEQKMADI